MATVAVIPGDGAGREVIPEALKVLGAAGVELDLHEYDLGADRYLASGEIMPESVFAELRDADAILFGAVGDPRVKDPRYMRDMLLRLRFELDLYANLRPARLLDARLSPLRDEGRRNVDLLLVRENVEGPYVGMGGRMRQGTEDEVALQEDVNTARGVKRILGCAFAAARREVCMVDKSNAMTHVGAVWQEQFAACKAPASITRRHLYVDAAAMQLVRDPSQFDVIVTSNLFGDILSDLAAQLIGGMGLAPSANVNPESRRGLFEPVHGSAPDIAGRGVVNPLGAIWSAAMMVEHLGHRAEADAIENAIRSALQARECTRDVGGELTTAQAGDAVARRL